MIYLELNKNVFISVGNFFRYHLYDSQILETVKSDERFFGRKKYKTIFVENFMFYLLYKYYFYKKLTIKEILTPTYYKYRVKNQFARE